MASILEIGCGSSPVNWVHEPADYLGVDPRLIRDDMRKAAKERLASNPAIRSAQLIAEDVASIPADDEFDLVFASNVLGNKHSQLERIIIARMGLSHVAAGGKLVMVDYVTPPNQYQGHSIAAVADSNFVVTAPQQGTPEFRDKWSHYMPTLSQPKSTSMIIAERRQ